MKAKTTTNLPNTLENFWANRPGLKEKCEKYEGTFKPTFTSTIQDVTPAGYGPSK